MSLQAVLTGVLLLWAAAVAAVDWHRRKVPNLLLLLLLLPALAVLVWQGRGLTGAGWLLSAVGMLLGLAVTLPGYFVSKLGAGDVKLAAVAGFVLAWPQAQWFLMISALVLGGMALLAVLHLGLANARNTRLPAAVAFAGGFAATLLLGL